MAQIGNLEIFLTADTSEFAKSVEAGKKLLTQIADQFKASGKTIQDFNANTLAAYIRAEKAAGSASGVFSQLNSTLKPIEKTLASQNSALVEGTMNLKSSALAYLEESKATDIANQVTKQATEIAKQHDAQIKKLSSSLWLMTAGLQQFGSAMTKAFTVPIVGAATAAVATFTEWQKAEISIQRAAEISTASAKAITDSFVTISQQIPVTVTDLQKAGYAAAQAGVTGETALVNFAKAATMLSTVGGDALKSLPIDDLSNQLAKLSIAFGETGNNWEKINNIASTLLAVSKAVPGGLGEVVDGMRRVSGTAALLNISLADTTALVGTLVAAGAPASRAGTELNTALMDLTANSYEVGRALGYTNENMDEFDKRMNTDMIGVLNEVIKRFSLIKDSTERAQAVQDTFGNVAAKALIPLINNTEILADLQAKANEEFKNGTTLTNDFDIQANSLSGTFTVFANVVKSVAKVIGDDLAPYISWLAKNATAALIAFAETWKGLPGIVKTVVVAIAALLAVLGPAALLINTAFISPIAGIITFTTKTIAAITALGAAAKAGAVTTIAMDGVGTSFFTATAGVSTFMAGLSALAIRFLAITAIIAAFTAAIYVLAKAVGFQIKLPEIPEVNLPKTTGSTIRGTANADKTGSEDYEATTKADEKAAEERQKALEKELKAKKKAEDKEISAIQDGIDAYEKVRNAQIKAQQKLVDETQDELDAKKDQWDEEKSLEEEKITAQQDILDAAKKTLNAAKKQLNALKESQDKQVETAEQAVDYAQMNLENAQEALKKEKLLGNDIYDTNYQKALAEVEYWQKELALKKSTLLTIQKQTQAEVDYQQTLVDGAQDQVDVQEEALDALKDALDKRTTVVNKEINLIEDELKVRKDALDDIKTSTQEKLDLLKEEKDAKQKEYDKEISAIQDNVDAAKEATDKLKSAYNVLPKETEELVKLAQQSGEDMQKYLDDLKVSFSKQDMGIKVNFDDKSGLFGKGRLQDIPEALRLMWAQAQKDASESGVSVGTAFMAQIQTNIEDAAPIFRTVADWGQKLDKSLVDAVFGKGTWDRLDQEAAKKGKNLSNAFTTALLQSIGNLAGSLGVKIFESVFGQGSWEQINNQAKNSGTSIGQILINSFIESVYGKIEEIKGSIFDTFFGVGTWEELNKMSDSSGKSISQLMIDSFKTNISTLVSSIAESIYKAFFGEEAWSEINRKAQESGKSVVDILWTGFKDKISGMYNNVLSGINTYMIQPIKDAFKGAFDIGKSLITGLIDGIKSIWENIKSVGSDLFNKIKDPLQYLWQYAYGWGKDLISGLGEGISATWKSVKKTFDNIVDYVKKNPVVEWLIGSPSKLFKGYGSNLMEGLTIGIDASGKDAQKALNDVVKSISDTDLSSALSFDPVTSSIGSVTSSQASGIASTVDATANAQNATTGTTVNKNYYIQPGQMIASRGEIRSFVRMLKEYEQFEEGR